MSDDQVAAYWRFVGELSREQGYPVRDEDATRLSPLGYAHINMLGRYILPAPSGVQRLRPLRDPDTDVG